MNTSKNLQMTNLHLALQYLPTWAPESKWGQLDLICCLWDTHTQTHACMHAHACTLTIFTRMLDNFQSLAFWRCNKSSSCFKVWCLFFTFSSQVVFFPPPYWSQIWFRMPLLKEAVKKQENVRVSCGQRIMQTKKDEDVADLAGGTPETVWYWIGELNCGQGQNQTIDNL